MGCCSGCSGDGPGAGGPAVWACLPAGRRAGAVLRISAPLAAKTDGTVGSVIFACSVLRLAVSELCGLPGGYPTGIYGGAVCGVGGLGSFLREAAAPGFLRFLERIGQNVGRNCIASKKIFRKTAKFCKKMLCKGKKIGYNKVAELWKKTRGGWRKHLWQNEKIPSAGSGWSIGAAPPCSNAWCWLPWYCVP